jgi:hypothetical protein
MYKSTIQSPLDDAEVDAEATRLGSRALFYSSCLTLFANFVTPLFVAKSPSHRSVVELSSGSAGVLELLMSKCKIGLPMLWTVSHALFATCMFATLYVILVKSLLSRYVVGLRQKLTFCFDIALFRASVDLLHWSLSLDFRGL